MRKLQKNVFVKCLWRFCGMGAQIRAQKSRNICKILKKAANVAKKLWANWQIIYIGLIINMLRVFIGLFWA